MTRTATPTGALATYLAGLDGAAPNVAATAYYASLDQVASVAPTVAAAIVRELADQRSSLKLIASENYSSLAAQLAHGNLLTDKYAEGYPGHRFYAGCDNVDAIESEAAGLACELFGADHAYVQPHSGADANLVAFLAILNARVRTTALADLGGAKPDGLDRSAWEGVRLALHNQKLLALDFYSGGHLTHGYRHNISSMLFDVHTYSVERESKLIDLDKLRAQVHQVRPLILLAGYSAYPRRLNFAAMRAMADEVGAVFMVDMAHFAGLVAGGVFTGDCDPVRHAHVVTSTTHKTLRGPRGGLILCDGEFAEWVDKGCPAVLGGPLPHAMAAKAVAFREANTPEFATYARSIVDNSRALASACQAEGMEVVTGGTDNHLVLVDVAASYGLTGRQAESALRACNITLNRNALPFDQNGPWYTSGLRVGTPAATTRGLGVADMGETARIMASILRAVTPGVIERGDQKGGRSRSAFHVDADVRLHARAAVATLLERYPLYPELDMDVLTES